MQIVNALYCTAVVAHCQKPTFKGIYLDPRKKAASGTLFRCVGLCVCLSSVCVTWCLCTSCVNRSVGAWTSRSSDLQLSATNTQFIT